MGTLIHIRSGARQGAGVQEIHNKSVGFSRVIRIPLCIRGSRNAK